MKAIIFLTMILSLSIYVYASASVPDTTDIESMWDDDSDMTDYLGTHNAIVGTGVEAYDTTHYKLGSAAMDVTTAWDMTNNTYSLGTGTEYGYSIWELIFYGFKSTILNARYWFIRPNSNNHEWWTMVDVWKKNWWHRYLGLPNSSELYCRLA